MEKIHEAIERAKASHIIGAEQRVREGLDWPQPPAQSRGGPSNVIDERIRETNLDGGYLQSKRIIAQDHAEPLSTSFDILRTQVLQSMDMKGWNFLGVTSPTPGCGKTVTAVNLTLSVARQPERPVLLVDLDLRKPQVASCLGIKSNQGVVEVLEERTTLASAVIQARIGNHRFMVLPTESPASGSSDRMASRAMSTMLHQIKKDYQSRIVIFDLPPLLSSDDVIAILPQLDCVLLVAAIGTSTVAEIQQCNKHLQSSEIVRVVVNKAPRSSSEYYNYY